MWRKAIAEEWEHRLAAASAPVKKFPLASQVFGIEEMTKMIDVLLSGKLTMGAEVERVEREFAAAIGSKYAVMVNSGSSANLLAVSAASNKARSIHCMVGDEVLVPSVCWSTSVFPIIQCGLRPIFVDVDQNTFNTYIDAMKLQMSPRVKAVMCVHVLGNAQDMEELQEFSRDHGLIIIEDTCEALGSTFTDNLGNEKSLGTFGDFGTFSFYFSHHITCGEGGMVVCATEEDYNLLRCLRSHGWTRHLTNSSTVNKEHPGVDERFLFVNLGYNLRPMEIQGGMLQVQLARLHEFNAHRRANYALVHDELEADPKFRNCMRIMSRTPKVDPAWFGIGFLLHEEYAHCLPEYLSHLESSGVETRPVISGNFIKQPVLTMYASDQCDKTFPGAEAIHKRGFFVGLHQTPLSKDDARALAKILLEFSFYMLNPSGPN